MNKKYQNNLKKVTVKDIKFSSNDNGIAVMYKYNQPFDEQAVKAIYDETKKDMYILHMNIDLMSLRYMDLKIKILMNILLKCNI